MIGGSRGSPGRVAGRLAERVVGLGAERGVGRVTGRLAGRVDRSFAGAVGHVDRRPGPAAGRAADRRAGRVGCDGSVALEVALAAPVVGMLVVGVLGMTTVVGDQLVAERSARVAARSLAVTGAVGDARAALPVGARLTVARSPRHVTVTVVVPGSVGPLPYEVGATATAVVEPAAG